MPPPEPPIPEKTLHEVVEVVGLYPIEAYEFVQQGLGFTVNGVHGDLESADPGVSRHISGAQLCEGLRHFALENWGMLARTVLGRWNIRKTVDFGRIVFALVEHGHMQKTDDDRLDDFKDVFDFKTAFEADYHIDCKTLQIPP